MTLTVTGSQADVDTVVALLRHAFDATSQPARPRPAGQVRVDVEVHTP